MPRVPSSQSPEALNDRLEARRPEIELAALARIEAISDPAAAPDPAYVEGLRGALGAALDYGLAAIAAPGREAGPVPVELLSQARLAARNGVTLDAVVRRYAAGHGLLADALLDEAGAAGVGAAELKAALRALAARFDAVVAAVGDEYGREPGTSHRDPDQRRAELVQRLLEGELLDSSELSYGLDSHHLGVIAAGSGAEGAVRDLAASLDVRLLVIRREDTNVWAWFGSRRPVDLASLEQPVSPNRSAQVSLAVGEPAHGPDGWRLSHHQARAALPIAMRGSQSLVRYADVALLASILQDDLLAISLRQLYLAPLSEERDGGSALRQTLRAYFAAERNVSSAAGALSVSRQTVVNRLHVIEERFERSLNSCAAEVEAALRLEDLGYPVLPHSAFTRS